ncbi:MAG: thioredoxin domain-containing protein [Nitrospirales bacterium]|nr:thioredoxin domain-containing protein [Nitrospirales bacterium]
MNRLATERSPYLRHAADQKIRWYPWCDEAFEKARQEDKPLFLSSGAVWCHWCHVMAKESFFDEEAAQILNDHFISIKLDRDERPEIDRRYQKAVSAMGAGGGWPLTVFLTPDRKPFFGGTYFPPEDVYGRPGFKKVLRAVIELYRTKRDEVSRYTDELMAFIRPGALPLGEVSTALLDTALRGMGSLFDPQNGGFGTAPKFPAPGALGFLLNRFFFAREEGVGLMVRKTLTAMAKGGFHDQLRGGFHRYSVDASWTVPHFEKMADDNAWLLRNYSDACSVFGDGYFREVARGIIAFTVAVLSDPDGGFYANQDADVTPDDEGGYFTWTEEEFRDALPAGEYEVLSLHLLHERGATHHDPSRKVLFVAAEPKEIAARTGRQEEEIREIITRGKEKLLQARDRRKAPFVDSTLYTSLNGMFITAYLKAFRVLGEEWIRDFALKSLHRTLREHRTGGVLLHTAGVKALLDDHIYLIEALHAAYEETGDTAWLTEADGLMEHCLERFWDASEGGFFDAETEVLGVRLKGMEDIPHPSANAVGIPLLLSLADATGKEKYRDYAGKALHAFAAQAGDFGVHAGSYFSAVDAYFSLLTLTVEASPGSALARAALDAFRPYKSIVYRGDTGRVIPCSRDACYEPVESPGTLRTILTAGK